MRTLFILLLAALLASCTTQKLISYTVQTKPEYSIAPAPQKVIVLNSYDPATSPKRKNIEQINTELVDLVVQRLAAVINRLTGIPAEPVRGLTPRPVPDSSLPALFSKYHASHAIVITFFDIAFEQTGVDVTRTSEGKSREAYYDICNTINFELYDQKALLDKSSYPVCKPHSSRMVLSGLLAAGPSYKANQEDFAKLSYENAHTFLRRYFPGEVDITRPIFIGGVFKTMDSALFRNDFDAAMAENMRLAQSSKARIAAMAYYNCAVLSERKNDFNAAHQFLHQSMYKTLLPQVTQMDSEFNGLPEDEEGLH